MNYEVRRLKSKAKNNERCMDCKSRKARVVITWYGQWVHSTPCCEECAIKMLSSEVERAIGFTVWGNKADQTLKVGIKAE